MHTKVFLIHNGSQRQLIEQVHEFRINNLIVLVQTYFNSKFTFRPEVKSRRQDSWLVISSQQMNGLRVLDFHAEQERNDLNTELPSVNEVSHEQVRRGINFSELLKNVQQVIKLSELHKSYPWMSPTTMTGDLMLIRFGSLSTDLFKTYIKVWNSSIWPAAFCLWVDRHSFGAMKWLTPNRYYLVLAQLQGWQDAGLWTLAETFQWISLTFKKQRFYAILIAFILHFDLKKFRL